MSQHIEFARRSPRRNVSLPRMVNLACVAPQQRTDFPAEHDTHKWPLRIRPSRLRDPEPAQPGEVGSFTVSEFTCQRSSIELTADLVVAVENLFAIVNKLRARRRDERRLPVFAEDPVGHVGGDSVKRFDILLLEPWGRESALPRCLGCVTSRPVVSPVRSDCHGERWPRELGGHSRWQRERRRYQQDKEKTG